MINTSTLVPTGSSRIPNWVSGGSYVIGDQAMSPITFLAYVRKTNGGGVTDPSADTTNWTPFGMAEKQIILGIISVAFPATSNTATISAVNTAKSKISFLGSSNSGNNGTGYVTLTNSTTVTAVVGHTSGNTVVAYQIVENY